MLINSKHKSKQPLRISNSFKATRNVPRVKKISQSDLQKSIINPVSNIPTISKYQDTQKKTSKHEIDTITISNNDWHYQSQFEELSSSDLLKTNHSPLNKLDNQMDYFNKPEQTFDQNKNESCLKQTCARYSYVCLFLHVFGLILLVTIIAATILTFIKIPTITTITTATTTATTSTNSTSASTCSNFTVLVYWNFPGHDLTYADPISFDICCAWCLFLNNSCVGYAYTISTSKCWIKSSINGSGLTDSDSITAIR